MNNDKIEQASTNRRGVPPRRRRRRRRRALAPYLGRAGIVGADDRHRRRRPRQRSSQPVRHRRRLHRRRGHLQRRLRHRLRRVRRRHLRDRSTRARPSRSRPSTQIAHGAAAPLRRRQPARPHRQLRRPGDRVQHDPRPARGPQRRHRRPQPRGHHDPRHPVRRRAGAGHLRRQARGDQLRPHGLRRLVLGEPVRGERLDPADDLGRGASSSAPRPRSRTSTCSAGARRRRPTTRRWPSTRRSRRAATRSAWRWRTSSRGCWSQPAVQDVVRRR